MITAIILAGGLGTRLKDAVPDVPKPMAPIMGKPFLELLLDYWIKQGINKFIISLGYKAEIISSYFGRKYKGREISYAIEKLPLGTGGGLLLALKLVSKKTSQILVINGDTFIEINLSHMLASININNADWGIAVFESRVKKRFMTFESNKNGKIIGINKENISNMQNSNGGAYLIKIKALKDLGLSIENKPISLETDILPLALSKKQKIYTYRLMGRFIDIGIPSDYYNAASYLKINNTLTE